ncbi:MAG: hypothetical protein SFY69_07700 [Planctomycetota bacterium]|nr:hypothetical protein [Planctomycetota bacterium]
MKNNRAWLLLAAAGTCATALPAMAQLQQGRVVNISGATLLQNWSASRASTNDFIDADGDGISGYLGTTIGGVPDQLAPSGVQGFGTSGSLTAQELVVQYRVTGSVNGFNELLRWGPPQFLTNDANATTATGIPGASPATGLPNPGQATGAYHNRDLYITIGTNSGVRTGAYNQGNPGGAPNRAADQSSYRATYATPDIGSAGGIQIDVSPLDVSTFLAVQKPGVAKWDRAPAEGGYGTNPRNSVNKQGGTSGANLSSQLLTLQGRNLFDPTNPGAADANTIFDTQLLFAPIAPVVGLGTGITQLKITEIQHLFVTGRANTGENFVVVTRDVGSGTRNAFNNCTGVDPSWGNGDNIGPRSSGGTQNNLGAGFIPTNKNGNGDVEATMLNMRLGVGYIGTERGVTGSGTGSWLSNGWLEIADVQNDIYGGTAYTRPTTDNILNNGVDGWLIGGQAVLATIGDPRACELFVDGSNGFPADSAFNFTDSNGNGFMDVGEPSESFTDENGSMVRECALGGIGWTGAFDPFVDTNNNNAYDMGEPFTDLNGNGMWDATNAEAGLTNTNPPMRNTAAALYMNNISRSIAAFQSVPADVANFGMPGEFAASQFLSLAALDNLHSDLDYTVLTPNPTFNQKVQDYIGNPANGNVHFNAAFVSFNSASRGRVPGRTTGVVYSDGVAGGQNYIDQAGNAVTYTTLVTPRNKIVFDFNGDGVRSTADATDAIRAWSQRNGGPAWSAPDGIYGAGAGQQAVIEILGDVEGNGSFDRLDIRYWADGLALVNGQLDRRAGFLAVDNASQTVLGNVNFFGTILSNAGETYAAGDSRADVANASNAVGAAAAINGCITTINPTTRGWAPIGADGNGDTNTNNDRVIDCVDVSYVVRQFNQAGITGAANWSDLDEAALFDISADMDADLDVDADDAVEIIVNILNTQVGDVNLDGSRDAADIAIAMANMGTPNATYCCGDVDFDGDVDQDDLNIITGSTPCDPDFNQDGNVDQDDIFCLAQVVAGDPSCSSVDPDFNRDGNVDQDDISILEQVVAGSPCP